jgi:hypothetical protein
MEDSMAPLRTIATISLIAISTLSLAAEQQATTSTIAGAVARSAAPKAASDQVLKQFVVPKQLLGAHSNMLSTIQGQALTSSGGQLGSVPVRLRDVRFGRIVDSQITDKTGAFVFQAVDPGNYVVELMNVDRTVMAATQVLNVNAGQAISAVLKMPFRIPPFAGVLGNSTPSAAAVTSEAAASGVLATTTVGEPISPGK